MDPEFIELKNLFEKINLKLNFELSSEQINNIKNTYPDKFEQEIHKLKKNIYKKNVERAEILTSFLTIKYNFNYNLLLSLMKKYNNLIDIDIMEKRIISLELKKSDIIDVKLAIELEEYYYNYIYHYYKIVLEKIENIKLIRLIIDRIVYLKDVVYKDYIEKYKLINRDIFNKELLKKYEDNLHSHFFNNLGGKKLTKFRISLPENLEIFRNKRVNNGLNQGNYIYLPLDTYRKEKEVNIGDTYQFKGQNIISTKKRNIYPIIRLSKFTTIPREVLMSYNYKILGLKMDRINIIRRLEEINRNHDFIKKLLFTIFLDYLLLFISDLNNFLKDLNLGLIVSGGMAYRYYNHSYITEDIDLILGDIIDNKISIKPILNPQELFRKIIEYFNKIKEEDFNKDILLNIIRKFFKDINRLGININNYQNIKNFYIQLENNNIDIELNLSTPPKNDKILKLILILNKINIYSFIDININDKIKAISTLSIINNINPFEIEQEYIKNEFNVDILYLSYQKQIENTFYPITKYINPIYDTASILNIINLDYILFEKSYLINKLNNNLLFGIISINLSRSKLYYEIPRLLEKFNKLLINNNEYNRFYSFNPSPEQIKLFNTFIG
jgi:hypothetical protein